MRRRMMFGFLAALLVVSMLSAAFFIHPAKAAGTIYIRADGSIDPPTAPISRDGNVYALTENISSETDGIVIEKDNIILDGKGFTMEGTGNGAGLNLTGRRNITLMNVEIKSFNWGIWLAVSSTNTIAGNNVVEDRHGIALDYSSNSNMIVGNDVTTCDFWGVSVAGTGNLVVNNSVSDCVGDYGYGINLYVTSNNIATDNRVFNNTRGVRLYHSEDNIIRNNEISNNSYGIYSQEGSSNNSISGNNIVSNECGIYLDSSSNSSISGNNISNNFDGINLSGSSNNFISGNNINANNEFGIQLDRSSNNSIVGNEITNNDGDGIYLYSSSDNTLSNNVLMSNRWFGFSVQGAMITQQASNNTIMNNTVTGSVCGLQFWGNGEYYNTVKSNMIYSNGAGIQLGENERYNTFCGNTLSNNQYGFMIMNGFESSKPYGNRIFHNNFIDNTHQAVDNATGNVWNDAYPSGGNYWSDYAGVDLYSNLYQNETGSDGIGDTPYVIDVDNIDHYPLMQPWTPIVPKGPGDVNGDGVVDIYDVVLAIASYGSMQGDPNWNPDADLAWPYGRIDILDLVTCASHYGEKYP